MNPQSKRLALFIDGENVPKSNWIDNLLKKINKLGYIINPKKIVINDVYLLKNKETLEEIKLNRIEPIFTQSSLGKNRADFRLYLEVMNLIYLRNDIDAYCIVSSDSDFAELIYELNNQNKYLIGVGEKIKIDSSYTKLFDKFIFIEDLVKPIEETKKENSEKSKSKSSIKNSTKKSEQSALNNKNDAKKEEIEIVKEELQEKENATQNVVKKEETSKKSKSKKKKTLEVIVEEKPKSEPQSIKNEEKQLDNLTTTLIEDIIEPLNEIKQESSDSIKRTNKDKDEEFYKILDSELTNYIDVYKNENVKETSITCSELISALKSKSTYLKSFKKISPKDIEKCGYLIKTLDDKGETSYINFVKEVIA